MAETEPNQAADIVQNQENNDEKKKLKYLDFVQVVAMYVLVCFTCLYEYAKQNSGPLKPGVQTVEGTVKTVIGPIYDKFHDVPFELLKFVDRKVDESLIDIDRRLPSLVKQASRQACAVACEVQRAGVIDAAKSITRTVCTRYEPRARDMYHKYEPVAEQYAASAWRSLNRLSAINKMAQIAVPTAGYWSERYNQAVCGTAERGYAAAAYLPLIPIEKIAKVFGEDANGPTVSTNGVSH